MCHWREYYPGTRGNDMLDSGNAGLSGRALLPAPFPQNHRKTPSRPSAGVRQLWSCTETAEQIQRLQRANTDTAEQVPASCSARALPGQTDLGCWRLIRGTSTGRVVGQCRCRCSCAVCWDTEPVGATAWDCGDKRTVGDGSSVLGHLQCSLPPPFGPIA